MASPAQSPAERGDWQRGNVDVAQIQGIIAKRRSGEALTAQDEALVERVQQQLQQSGGGMGGGDGGGRGGGRNNGGSTVSVTSYQFGGDYWVVTMDEGEPVPVSVRTGLTDLEYSEIVTGLDASSQVLLLPSSSLFEQQETIRNIISSRLSTTPFQATGGGGPPGGGGGGGGMGGNFR